MNLCIQKSIHTCYIVKTIKLCSLLEYAIEMYCALDRCEGRYIFFYDNAEIIIIITSSISMFHIKDKYLLTPKERQAFIHQYYLIKNGTLLLASSIHLFAEVKSAFILKVIL